MKYKLSLKLHEDIVLGKDKSFSRSMAIKMLLTSKVLKPAILLKKVLEDDNEEPKFRRLAAVGLWQLNTTESIGYLQNSIKIVKDPDTLTAIVKCLGRICNEKELVEILEIKRTAHGVLAAQASFAASLISYRFGLQDNDLPMSRDFVEMPRTPNQRLKLIAALNEEADLFNNCMAHEPYGIELSNDSLLQFNCPAGDWIIGFNSIFRNGNAVELLKKRKTFLGIVAAKHNEDGHYSVSYLILSMPQAGGDKVDILINRITGEPAWSGTTTTLSANQAKFLIRTVGTIGIVPMEIEASINVKGNIIIDSAITANRVIIKQSPQRLDIAPI
jgi:hypothetical protein